jgi:xanthine dehydrogenase YagS FAD-binding subunit
MKNFSHVNAGSVEEAIRLLGVDRSRAIAGGTDLLTLMKPEIVAPDHLVNLKSIPGMDYVRFEKNDGLRIGALATLSEIMVNKTVREQYPLLVRAISVSASPQLRNRGTIGGNLNQAPRCWYYRGQFHCWLKGGQICYAREGQNAHHAIFQGGPCYAVHPSDPAPALVALGAQARIVGPDGERNLPLEELFQAPRTDSRRLTILKPWEIVTELLLPVPSPGSRGIYLKAMERRVWAFAQVGVALQVALDGENIREIRVVAGGVSATPWRLKEVEGILRGRVPDEAIIDQAAGMAASGAKPLSHNGYKVPLIQGLLKEALLDQILSTKL